MLPKYDHQVNGMVKCLAGRWDLGAMRRRLAYMHDATADKFSDTHSEEHNGRYLYGQI